MSKKSRQERRRMRMKALRAASRRAESSDHRTLATVQKYLKLKGLSTFGNPENGFIGLDLTFYPPEEVTYRNEDGEAACKVIITACKDGQFVTIASPDAWNLRNCPHRASVYETLVRVPPDLPIVRFHHDPKSDGVTPFAIMAVGDRGAAADSIRESLIRVIHAIPRWDPVIQRAVTTGEVSVPGLPDSGEGLSPAEVKRIGHGLIDRLTEDVKARWQRARQDIVVKAGSDGIVAITEEPQSDHLMGTAVIVYGGRLLALAPTLPAGFARIMSSANQVATGVISRLVEVLDL